MKLQITLLASLLFLLPNLVQAQTGSQGKPSAAKAERPAAVGFSRENPADACTTAPRSEWLPEDEMKLLATHRGYRIKTFKIAKGNCYEVYGFNRDNQIVEAYFHPVTSRLVRQNIAH